MSDSGSAIAQRVAERDYSHVVSVDAASNGYAESAGSDVVVMAVNEDLTARAAREVQERSPDAVVIVASHPAAALCHRVLEVTKFPRSRVIGSAGAVHSARLRELLADELRTSARDVTGLVLGGDGEAMVPLLSSCTVAGIPVGDLLTDDRLRAVLERTRDKSGAAPDQAVAAAVAEICDAILLDRRRLLSCAALCQGEYGIDNRVVCVPVKLGGGGIEQIVEIDLGDAERRALQASAAR